MDETRDIPLTAIHEPRLLLRLVERDSLEYMELRDAIDKDGLLNSICVRPSPRCLEMYEVVDGMYRFVIYQELGRLTIPCLIRDLTDAEVMAAQLQANAIRPTTKKTDFARQLKRLLDLSPGMTLAGLQHVVHKSPVWISEQLGLLRLTQAIQTCVDRGEIPLASAYVLSRVIPGEQARYVDLAKTAKVPAFKATMAVVIKKQEEAALQGRFEVLNDAAYVPVPYLRSLNEIVQERQKPAQVAKVLTKGEAKTPVDGWNLCLDWITHMDADGLEEQSINQLLRTRKWITSNRAKENIM